MSEQTASAEGLVTEPAPEKPTDPAIIDPAAGLDPAAKLDPAKARPTPAKAQRARRTPAKKRSAARKAAGEAKGHKDKAAKSAANAKRQHARTASAEGKAAYEAAVANEVRSSAALPERAALHLRLANDGAFVAGAIEVDRDKLTAQADRVTYGSPVKIGPEADLTRVDEAWLIAASGEAVRCAVGPIVGGGGHDALIPAGHLLF